MLIWKQPTEKSGLEKTIDSLMEDMKNFKGNDDSYSRMVDQLDTLYKLKEIDNPKRVSRDTLAIVTGNIVGILLIVTHEHHNVVTSKALNLLHKLR